MPLKSMLSTDVDQGEHGVGLVKRDYLPHELGETTVDLMRKVCYFKLPILGKLLTNYFSSTD